MGHLFSLVDSDGIATGSIGDTGDPLGEVIKSTKGERTKRNGIGGNTGLLSTAENVTGRGTGTKTGGTNLKGNGRINGGSDPDGFNDSN